MRSRTEMNILCHLSAPDAVYVLILLYLTHGHDSGEIYSPMSNGNVKLTGIKY